jgi:hypothetical protein
MANRFEDRDQSWQEDEDWSDQPYYDNSQSSRGRQSGRYASENRGEYGRGRYSQNRFSSKDYERGYNRGMNRDYQSRAYNRGESENYDQNYDYYDANRDPYNRGDYGRYNRGRYGQSAFRGSGYRGSQYRGSSMMDRPYRTGYSSGSDWNRDYEPYDEYETDYFDDYGYEYDQPGFVTYEEWWIVPGPFSGIGPRGYTRSDERIMEDISERLMQHGNINARNIEIQVDQGDVTLSGTVDDRRMKRLVEDTVESVYGVTDVHDNLRVSQPSRGRQQQRGQQQGQSRGQSQGEQMGGQMQGQQTRSMIRQGMDVVDSNGSKIGQVKEVRDNDFLVDRPMAQDIYIPFNACKAAQDQVVLNISSNMIDQQHWQTAEQTQSSRSR